ncbi:hypothetical protein MO867_15150 [Microbulbifer sp. OS29]|uniref:DUF1211 domain-containing protein n=1 Tax=Microbulbifer okhotskensis TaxID=2926617 RepID=A0A9X2EU87_9GAMM|nr:hypothetical protein [Microbulbifer okhotskensis]MCO1335673.1 hypothetical protein [Microbulbifer okhotskensis]
MHHVDTGTIAIRHNRLRRLENFIDVAYALLFVNFVLYLPSGEDMAWTKLEFGLLSLLLEHSEEIFRLFIAVGLTLVQWNLTHKLLGPIEQSNNTHTALVLFQLVVVCFYLYFAISDPKLVSISSTVGQSLCLALSGFIGLAGWQYARKKGFANSSLTNQEKDNVLKSATTEPSVAVITVGLAFISPVVWSVGWLIIPLIILVIRKKIGRR